MSPAHAFARSSVRRLADGARDALAAQVLFDGNLNTQPNLQGWAYLTHPMPIFGASAIRSLTKGATILDTTPAEDDHAGWFANLPPLPAHPQLPVLDRTAGYTLRWTVRLEEESHSSPNRAGLSVIALSSDLRGVELGHWTDEVWVQDDEPLFTHGEGAAIDTTASRIDYELCVLGDSYSLRADGALLFEGLLRDYSAFGAPYDIPNFLFVGDDTTSAQGRFTWARFEVELEACGCSAELADSDGDGVPDCADACPSDPGKDAPGTCGCGIPDRDRDGDTVADCDAIPGDLHPDGSGDDLVTLADFLVAHRKLVLASSPVGDWDLLAGDLAPDAIVCERPDARLRACPAADGTLDPADGSRVRALVADRLEISCAACEDPPPGEGSSLRRPGDVAPRAAGGDAAVNVGDTILVLRWAVGLDLPTTPEEQLRADVGPLVDQDGTLVVSGDGTLDVADVILILRASVGLTTLRWPTRELHADLADASEALAFTLTISDIPPSTTAVDATSPHCPPEGIGGLDAVADRWSLTCASEPALLTGPTRLGSLRYRAPEPLDPGALVTALRVVDASLSESAAGAELSLD